jgi:hypothetical protein
MTINLHKSAVLMLCIASSLFAADDRAIKLTIYNSGNALIKDTRTLDLKAGVNLFRFTDVAATIDPTSVRFRSQTDPAARIIEQNFEFDLVGSQKLLEKYIDRTIETMTRSGELISGTLLSAERVNIIIQTDAGLKILPTETLAAIRLTDLPEGLITKPTLVWQMLTEKGGTQNIQLDYLAEGITWEVAYNAVLSDDEKSLDIAGWATLTNHCGTTFPSADVTLISGSPSNDDDRTFASGVEYLRTISTLAPTTQRGNETAETFSEYHLYRLASPTTLAANQIKQIQQITATAVPVKKIYLYDGANVRFSYFGRYSDPGFGRDENKKVNTILQLENRADHRLGIALPQGKVRLYKRDSDGSQEFIGEDRLPDTAVDERILLYMGDAFDLTGQRKQTNFKRISEHVFEESFAVTVKNHKTEAVTITVIEKLYRSSDWRILESSQKYDKLNSRTIRFDVPLQGDEEKTITYRVRYTW